MAALVEVVMVAVAERDLAVAAAEAKAGQALRMWSGREGQSLAEFVAWCDGAITAREAARLRRLGSDDEGLRDESRDDAAAAPAAGAADEVIAPAPTSRLGGRAESNPAAPQEGAP